MMDALPSIAKVFSYVFQQERQLASNDIMGNTSLINAVNTNSSNLGNSSTYYGKDNHIIGRCYRKMVFLKIMLLEKEEETKVTLVEETQEEEEASYVHIVVLLTTL